MSPIYALGENDTFDGFVDVHVHQLEDQGQSASGLVATSPPTLTTALPAALLCTGAAKASSAPVSPSNYLPTSNAGVLVAVS